MITWPTSSVVAGREVSIKLITSRADQRGSQEGLYSESGEVLRIEVWVLTLEVTARVDGLENRLAIVILAIGGTTELPVVTVDDDSGVARAGVVTIKNKWFEYFHVLNDESTVLEDCLGITAGSVRGNFLVRRGK